ncbi:MAG: hypothetical protein AB3N28_11910, partial [Kordiimonas sp.]
MGPNNHILWLICGGAALALHAGAAALFFGENSEAESSQATGQKGVLVELTFEGAAAGGRSQVGNVDEKTAAVIPKAENALPKKSRQKPLKEIAPKTVRVKNVLASKPAPLKPQRVKAEPVSPPSQAPAEQQPTNSAAVSNDVGLDQGAEVEAVTNSIGGAGGFNKAAAGKKGGGKAAQFGGMGG